MNDAPLNLNPPTDTEVLYAAHLLSFTKWIAALLLSGTLAWATYVTASLHEDRATLQLLIDRLARIETKIDMIMERESKQ